MTYLMVVVIYVLRLVDDDFLADLVVIPMELFDLILGMDWLSRYQAVKDCARQWVSLYTKNDQIVY